jgi:hypothetical protein
MTRTKLPERRASETRKITIRFADSKEQKILITIGFDDAGEPKEVFCADFKAGSDLHALVMDACIVVSRCLQHGDEATDLVAAMCEGPSLIGFIVAAVADGKGPSTARDAQGRPVPPRPLAPAGACLAELVS